MRRWYQRAVDYIRKDGSPLTSNCAVTVDNYVTTFRVKIRSMSPVSEDAIRQLIQTRHEVVDIVEDARLIVVQ